MTIVNLQPRQENITGASLSGSTGAANRTYALANSGYSRSAGITIAVNGTRLVEGSGNDFTVSGSTITFINNVWNDQNITIDYYTTVSSSESTTDYATTLQVFEFLNWVNEVPEFSFGTTPSFETVDSTGSLTTGSVIYLDYNRVISGTLTLSYGAASTATLTDLTEDTDYTFDLDKAKITLTAAGASSVGTAFVFAEEYKNVWINDRPGPTDSHVSDLITRASVLIDEFCSQTFSPVSQITNEYQFGKGRYDFKYRVENLPISVARTNLASAMTGTGTAMVVDSTTDMAAGQYLSIENEAVLIDSVDSTSALTVTRSQLSTSAVAHTATLPTINAVFEVSNTPIGSNPSYTFLEFEDEWSVDGDTGLFTFMNNNVTPDGLFISNFPEKGVPDRTRLTYSYGLGSVPTPITHACILQVSKWLVSAGYAKRASEGIDNDEFDVMGVLDEQVREILREYKLLKADGF